MWVWESRDGSGMNIELQSMAIALPEVARHPNRTEFRGVLTLVDVPSDKPPTGARGHRVMLTREATERALPSLLGMGLDYAPALDRHDARRKVGVIVEANLCPGGEPNGGPGGATARVAGAGGPASKGGAPTWGAAKRDAAVAGTQLEVSGYLYGRDFPEVVRELRKGGRQLLGMSYEIADVQVADMEAPVWQIEEFTFTGAALLRREKAAYGQTWIELK